MKVCITSTGNELDSSVDERFGRTPYFIIVDTETDAFEAVENSCAQNAQGAGTGAVGLVVDKGIDVVLTGRVGPKATAAFQTTSVQLIEGISSQTSVRDVLAEYKSGGYASGGTATTGQADMTGVGTGKGMGGGRGMGLGGGRGCGRGMGGGGCGMGGGGRRSS